MPLGAEKSTSLYGKPQLKSLKRDEVRKIARSFSLTSVNSKKKDQLIDMIIQAQSKREGGVHVSPQLPKLDEFEDPNIF